MILPKIDESRVDHSYWIKNCQPSHSYPALRFETIRALVNVMFRLGISLW